MVNKYIKMSRPLSNNMPCYNGEKNIEIIPDNSIVNGDSTNSIKLKMGNHVGTHIDFPHHFYINGKTIDDYPTDWFIFNKISILDIPMDSGMCITAGMIADNCNNVDYSAELLIIRTGYGRYYELDKYWSDNPGLSPEAVLYIKNTFLALRVLCVDFISINAYNYKPQGREAHKILLDMPEIAIIEDIDLSNFNNEQIVKVIIVPLHISGADGTPCSILAEIK